MGVLERGGGVGEVGLTCEVGDVAAEGVGAGGGDGLAGEELGEGVAEVGVSDGAARLAEGGDGVVDAAAVGDGAGLIDDGGFGGGSDTGGFDEFVMAIDDARVIAVAIFLGVLADLGVSQGGVNVDESAGDALRFIVGAYAGHFVGERVRDGAIVGDEEEDVGFVVGCDVQGVARDSVDIEEPQQQSESKPVH